ncbi:APC membrane recruitment protein 2-like protein [Lates japonicus]|uniref:APC membrane recruitment protein 2-like protein n=1 Tax=Lates japonicus TaxID=270547 RepID=A0AAD3QX36_LATJO|nr:APC membrane recruitment protein 2-like protein [Lates japonicus]
MYKRRTWTPRLVNPSRVEKIKGLKLFGKRKPANIFSIRNKGDGNNKSPVIRSKTLDGLSETTAPDSEQEPDKEKGQEVSQGEREQAEEETLGEDGVLAAAPARTSISSASSAKSLSFLSLLRGGRRGVGDRRVHTVSQPVGRQRRGLKGLFGNVKFRSKDKEDKEEAPPSPLLMSSRANSVEIIKEDLTLTPKSQPRSLDSPETESCEPVKSLTSQGSAETSPSETLTPQATAGNVSRTNEHVPPLPASEPPLVPGDNSLSSLLADISSLLTFDSISGGGDIMADVEAEWGKASSPVVSEVTSSSTSLFYKPTISSPLTSTSVSTAAMAKTSYVAAPTTTQSFTPLTKTTLTSSPIAKPSTIITTLTKSSTLTTHSVKLSSDSNAASASIKIKSTPVPAETKLSTTPATLTSLAAPMMSSSSITIKSTPSSTSATTTAPPNTPATIVKAPSISPTLTSTASKLASEIAAPQPVIDSISKPSPLATPPSASAKPPPVTHSPLTAVTFTQPPPTKLDSVSSLNLQTSTSFKPSISSAAGESKAPVTASTVSPACTVTKPSSPSLVIPSKMSTVTTSTTTSGSVSAALSKPTLTSSPVDFSKTPPSLVTVPDLCPPSTLSATTKAQPSHASVPTPSSASLDKILPTTKLTPALVSLDKTPPAPTPPALTTHAVASTASPAPPVLGQIPVSQTKPPPAPAQIPISASKDPPAPAQIPVSVSKPSSALAQTPVSVPKDPLAPAQIPVSIPASVPKDPPIPAQTPVSVSKDPPAPAQIPVSQPKTIPAPTPAPAPCPVTSLPSAPAPWPSEPPVSPKIRGSGQASVDGPLASPTSTGAQGAQTGPSKPEELYMESRTSLQGPSKERRIPQVKASGLSKIPVVGGGRAGKLPVRDSQHVDDEASRDPPTPVLEEEKPHFNSHDAGSKDKISDIEANVPTFKHTQEESQQPPQPKVLTSLPRDSKIPVKHGAQSHTASQIPQAKEPPRTKIPVSKVPVRRVGNKPAAAGGSTQIRK